MSVTQVPDRFSAASRKIADGGSHNSTSQGKTSVAMVNQRVFLFLSKFHSISEVDSIKRELGKGNVVFLDFSEFLEDDSNDTVDLKRAIEQLRGYCQETGGDIGRIGEELLILTPNKRIKIF